jgi:putative ABC transport system ATP-binding protein
MPPQSRHAQNHGLSEFFPMPTPPADRPSPPVLQIDALQHGWSPDAPALFQVPRLTLQPGESLFIHGPSGCGKSTLLSLLCGVGLARSGRVSVQGQDWRGLAGHRRDAWRADHIGYIFQQFNLLPYLSALDNVTLPCVFSARRRQGSAAQGGAQAEARMLLSRMQLPEPSWTAPSARLSVGQQQRVAAARALMGRPALVVADEPTSALDEATRAAFMDTFLRVCGEAQAAVVFVSHDQRLAAHFQRSLGWDALMGAPT